VSTDTFELLMNAIAAVRFGQRRDLERSRNIFDAASGFPATRKQRRLSKFTDDGERATKYRSFGSSP
jgi:hypothetical protein